MAGPDQVSWPQLRPCAMVESPIPKTIGGTKYVFVHACIIVPTKPRVQRLDQLANGLLPLNLEPLGHPGQRCAESPTRCPADNPRYTLVVHDPTELEPEEPPLGIAPSLASLPAVSRLQHTAEVWQERHDSRARRAHRETEKYRATSRAARCGCGQRRSSAAGEVHPLADGGDELKAAFNRDAGSVRLILLLSPT